MFILTFNNHFYFYFLIFQEQYKLKESVFGSLPTISKEEFDSFYHSTGIDLDNRLHLMELYAKSMEESIRRFVNFAKTIPSFTNLTLSDQSSLIKGKLFKNLVLSVM